MGSFKMFRLLVCTVVVLSASANSLAVDKETDGLRDSCGQCLIVKATSSSVSNSIPWLFNKAKFYLSHTDGEGVFYNGFWVVNDDEDGYVEETGRVFVYNTSNGLKSGYCPVDSGNNWYYFTAGDWVYDASISVENC